jgi:hypothetical protein
MLVLAFINSVVKAGEKLSVINIGNLVSVTSGKRTEIIECSSVQGAELLSDKLEDYYTAQLQA